MGYISLHLILITAHTEIPAKIDLEVFGFDMELFIDSKFH